MKSYSKPTLFVDETTEINEPVYLVTSGWKKSSCWDATVEIAQPLNIVWSENNTVARLTLQLDGTHAQVDHHCYREYLIFHFADLSQVSGFGYHSDLNGDEALSFETNGNLARVTAKYHGNSAEMFGSGALFMYVSGLSGEQDVSELAPFIPTGVEIYDTYWRTTNHTLCDQYGHW